MSHYANSLNDLISSCGRVDSFDDGLVKVATDLTLELLHAEAREVETTRATVEKSVELLAGEAMDGTAIKKVIGEKYVPRRTTKTTATGTIYGPVGELDVSLRQNSIFGLNPMMLTCDGAVNPVALLRRMREIAPAFGLRETRLNRLINAVVTRDFYENYVILCFSILQRIALVEFYEKTTTYKGGMTLRSSDVKNVVLCDSLEKSVEQLRIAVTTHVNGAGVSAANSWLFDTADAMRSQYRSLALSEGSMFEQEHHLEWREWHMFSYDDGHSRTGEMAGDIFGFVNGRMIVDTHWAALNMSPINTTRCNAQWPDSDEAIDALENVWGWLNVSGFSPRDLQVLDTILNGVVRRSPFLVDQTLAVLPPKKVVNVLHAPAWHATKEPHTRADLVRVFRLLISNHRIHEDALAATHLIQWWMALPGPESVQSWQWMSQDFVMSLPVSGFRRAYIAPLTEGEGVGLTEDAIASYASLQRGHIEVLWTGLLLQTAWAWGEYLFYYNQPSLEQIVVKMHGSGTQELTAFDRAAAFASAVLGRSLRDSPFDRTGMRIVGGVESSFGKTIPFGELDWDVSRDTGYTIIGSGIRFGGIVAPGCMTLIVGLGGTLMRNTPYANIFEIKEGARFYKGGVYRQAVNYEDLWAAGVVARWQGYDMYYSTPISNDRHVMYAANDVSVAYAPRGVQTLEMADLYLLRGTDERAITFGTRYDPRFAIRCRYAWRRSIARPLRTPFFKSEPCEAVRTDVFAIREVRIATAAAAQYKLYVYGNYDLRQTSFQISVVTAGAGLRTAPAPITRGVAEIPDHGTPYDGVEMTNDAANQDATAAAPQSQ